MRAKAGEAKPITTGIKPLSMIARLLASGTAEARQVVVVAIRR